MTYSPNPPPSELTVQSIWDEFTKLRDFVETMQVDYVSFRKHNVAPSRPKVGRVYYADGANWDPGNGAGLYSYTGTAWVIASDLTPSIVDNGNATAITISSAENVTLTNELLIPDNKRLLLGTGSDFKAYHDAINSYIDNATGLLSIRNQLTSGKIRLQAKDSGGTTRSCIITEADNTKIYTNTGTLAATFDSSQNTTLAGNLTVGNVSLAAGKLLTLDRTTEDAPLINYKATINADATSAISSFTTSAAVTHHIQVSINGAAFWIPGSTTDPTA